MPVVTSYTLNTFCFPGFCSGDSSACKRFYADVLGWTGEDKQMPEGQFTAFMYDGELVAGMYQMAEDRKAAGVRPHWNSYIAVRDVDEIARRTEKLGGKIISPPVDAMGDRMAFLEDPDGVRFSAFQAGKTPEPTRRNDIGALCWTELYCNRPEAMATFYSELLGWQPKPFESSPMPYTTFDLSSGEPAHAGMLQISPEMQGMQPHWMPYFMVEDVDGTLRRATAAGGQTHGPMDIPGAGRIAFIVDAEGADFGIIKPETR